MQIEQPPTLLLMLTCNPGAIDFCVKTEPQMPDSTSLSCGAGISLLPRCRNQRQDVGNIALRLQSRGILACSERPRLPDCTVPGSTHFPCTGCSLCLGTFSPARGLRGAGCHGSRLPLGARHSERGQHATTQKSSIRIAGSPDPCSRQNLQSPSTLRVLHGYEAARFWSVTPAKPRLRR